MVKVYINVIPSGLNWIVARLPAVQRQQSLKG